LLAFLAFAAGGFGLMTAYSVGWIPFLILLGMSLMGLSYNLRLIPKYFAYDKYWRLRDIPGSKTILIAMAWGVVTSVLPRLSVSGSIHLNTAIMILWSLSLVFVRTAFFDILDMQGDRIVGKETIPILLGEKRALRLLKTILVINFGILFISSVFQLIPSLGFLLLICPAFVFIMLSAHERGYMLPGIRLEFLVESNFVMAGVMTLVWSLL
jgi:4-hydroxy-3-methylbut-2-enyl diphosphate reductase